MQFGSPTQRKVVGTYFAVVVAYAIGSVVAWHGFGGDVGLAFFPPAGVTVAALLLMPRRRWVVLLIAIFATEFTVDRLQDIPARYALLYGLANAVEPLVGAVCVQRLNAAGAKLDERRGKVSFLVGACGLGPLVGALIGASAVTLHRPQTSWVSNVAHWWAGDGIAVLAIGASVVLFVTTALDRRQRLELLAGAMLTVPVAMIGLSSPLAPATLALPLIAVMAVRVGPVGATVSGGVLAIIANYWTNAGNGYFANIPSNPASRLAYLQVFLAVLIVVGWSIGIEVQSRLRAVTAGIRLERQRSDATAAVEAISRAIAPRVGAVNGPFGVGSCYKQSEVRGLVGGDWFDVFDLPDGRLLFSVGDVVGHGVAAVEDMAQLRLATRAFACEGHSSNRVIEELSRYVHLATTGRFATIVVAIYEPSTRALSVASAGHPPPLRWRSGSGLSEYLAVKPGPPLGVVPDWAYVPMTVPLECSDVFVFYTDGVVERRGRSLDDGLMALRLNMDESMGDRPSQGVVLDELGVRLADTCHTEHAEDDRCVLVIRFGSVAQDPAAQDPTAQDNAAQDTAAEAGLYARSLASRAGI